MGTSCRRPAIVMLAVAAASCSLFTSNSEGRSGPCPAGMAYVTNDGAPAIAYCIDKWEASIVEVQDKGEVAHAPYEPVSNMKGLAKAVAKAGVIPQGYISKNEAESACKAARKRLCTADEWQFACRGKKPTTFPYGDDHK